MRANAKGYVILLAIFGTTILAFGFPFLLSGGGPEKRDDIVLEPRYTATVTPIDRALTQDAFARLFFTPTNLPVAHPSLAASPTLDLLIPVAGGNTITPSFTATLPTNTSQSVPPTPTRRRADDPNPTPTKTLAPVPTATIRPTNTPRPPTNTPVPTSTTKPTNTPRPPTNTPVPTSTTKPTDTPVVPTSPPVTPDPTDSPPTTEVPTSEVPATETD